jgi:hypothetical protein
MLIREVPCAEDVDGNPLAFLNDYTLPGGRKVPNRIGLRRDSAYSTRIAIRAPTSQMWLVTML